MSTPIKPPGGPPAGPPGTEDASDAGRVADRPGAFREIVDQAGHAESASSVEAGATDAPGATSAVGEVVADIRSGRVDVDGAVEKLVERALAQASDLPEPHRAALASQLREALSEDPTLVALRRDLERASTT